MSGPRRLDVPTRFLNNIETWLSDLDTNTYLFPESPVRDQTPKHNVFIGDIHADPRGFTTALRLSNVIDNKGDWITHDTRLILIGDVVDGRDRGGTVNPRATKWDELVCLRMIFELKQEAQYHKSDIIWIVGNHELMTVVGNDSYAHKQHL